MTKDVFMKKFALIGAAGYIAPRHMKAVKETGNILVAAMDKNDSVGVIDSYFPDAEYFTEFEHFDRYVDLARRNNDSVDYFSICSPNYLHDSHMRFALRSGGDAICEKPLVLDMDGLDGLIEIERDTGQKVNTILQLRLHDSVNNLKRRVAEADNTTKFDVDLTYIASRGKWYHASWKASTEKSGGIATNIGIHFFDMLHYIFGDLKQNNLHYSSPTTSAGFLEYEKARVRWLLSIDEANIPTHSRDKGMRTHRSITIGKEEFEFSGGFTDLHTRCYDEILKGNGFGLEENRVAIETVVDIRHQNPNLHVGEQHPILKSLT